MDILIAHVVKAFAWVLLDYSTKGRLHRRLVQPHLRDITLLGPGNARPQGIALIFQAQRKIAGQLILISLHQYLF